MLRRLQRAYSNVLHHKIFWKTGLFLNLGRKFDNAVNHSLLLYACFKGKRIDRLLSSKLIGGGFYSPLIS